MNTARDPLTEDERALAARLARLGVPDGPSPALDARILSAAHGAVQRAPASRRRWPLAVGAAASVVFALGIGWQLRPGQDEARVYSEADFVRAPGAVGPSAAEELPMAAESAAPVAQDVAPSVAMPAEVARSQMQQPQDASAASPESAQSAPAPMQEERNAFPAAAKAMPAPPAPPPPPPPEPPIVFDAPTPVPGAPPAAPAATAGTAAREAATPQRRTEPQAADDARALDEITVTGARIARDREGFSDDQLDQAPPATADSPEVQRAWLQRIREMVANGDVDSARASLGEFKRRYPRYALPEDLRDLAP